LLDSLSLGAFDVALHAGPPKGVLRSRETIFPRNDGAFPTVQLLLSGEELLLQLLHHR
jgi:hypothetical protein